jgi:hypothetical protein
MDELGGTAVEPAIKAALHRRRGTGRPLPAEVSARFGEQMGADFSSVRVHADSEADRIARAVSSVAFTQGSDIYFTARSFAPTTESGQHLLAHELAHVVQARTAPRSGGMTIGRVDDPAEAQAERVANTVVPALRRQALRAGTAEALLGGLPGKV